MLQQEFHHFVSVDLKIYIIQIMKGIILSGGAGSRLYPLTQVVNKQLLPVYDKPMIYYPLSTLVSYGIKDICIISSPEFIDSYLLLFKNSIKLGLNICYKIQEKPEPKFNKLLSGINLD